MTVTIPESNTYQRVMILDTEGYIQFYLTEPDVYPIQHPSGTLFIAVRTGIEDRHS